MTYRAILAGFTVREIPIVFADRTAGTSKMSRAIVLEATLSFLGVGLPPTEPSLGTLIRSGYDLMFAGAWWITVIPGVVLIGLLVSVNGLGDALRDALDPRLSPR